VSFTAALKVRLNRRLAKLAKWADSSADDRHSEFKNNNNMAYPYRTLTKPMLYSKPIPVAEINAMKNVKVPSYYSAAANAVSSPAAAKASPKVSPKATPSSASASAAAAVQV
jgi:hypothetical protein